MKKHGLKVLGLSLMAALGLMALTAAGAQAVVLSHAKFIGLSNEPESIEGSATEGELLTEGGIEIHCTEAEVEASVENEGDLGVGSAHILFAGCGVLGNPFCDIYESLGDWEAEEAEGMILATGHGYIFKHDGKFYLLVLGLGANQVFTDFGFAGPLCVLPSFDEEEHQEITGSTVFALPDAATSQAEHTVETIDPEELETLFPLDRLFLGEEGAHLAGGQEATVEQSSSANWSAE